MSFIVRTRARGQGRRQDRHRLQEAPCSGWRDTRRCLTGPVRCASGHMRSMSTCVVATTTSWPRCDGSTATWSTSLNGSPGKPRRWCAVPLAASSTSWTNRLRDGHAARRLNIVERTVELTASPTRLTCQSPGRGYALVCCMTLLPGRSSRDGSAGSRVGYKAPDHRERRRRRDRPQRRSRQPKDAEKLTPDRATRSAKTSRTVTADRGYGEQRIEDDLHDFGVRNPALPARAEPVPPKGRITTCIPTTSPLAHRLRGTNQLPQMRPRLDRTRLDAVAGPPLVRPRRCRPQARQDQRTDPMTNHVNLQRTPTDHHRTLTGLIAPVSRHACRAPSGRSSFRSPVLGVRLSVLREFWSVPLVELQLH